MKYIKSEVTKQANEEGYITDTFEKVLRLTDILKFINQDSFLKDKLVLKGGTAINLLLSSLPRLSVDIDLDYTHDEVEPNRDKIASIIKKYMIAANYELSSRSRFSKALDSFVYSYTNSSGNKDNIKIEINYVLRKHIFEASIKEVTINSDTFEVRMLHKIELYGSKITALLNRGAARDLFDIDNMIKNNLITKSEEDYLRKAIIFYSLLTTNEDELFEYDKLEAISEKKIKSDLYPVLRKRGLFDLIIAKQNASDFLTRILVPNDNEQKFIKKFYQGELDLALLFDDKKAIQRIKNHPMITWKLKHIKEHLKK